MLQNLNCAFKSLAHKIQLSRPILSLSENNFPIEKNKLQGGIDLYGQ